MWQLLLLLGAGFGIYTLTKEEEEKDGKNKDSKDNTFTFENKEYSDWKEELKDYIDAEGEDYALTEYDWSKVKNKSFQDALKNFKEKKKDLETAIKKLPASKKQYVNDVIDKEGFDSAFLFYSDFDYYVTDTGVDKPMNSQVFEKARKGYVSAFERIKKLLTKNK
jgi:hypothetical protein